MDECDRISERRELADPFGRLPRSVIHAAIIDVLHDFASNLTRYYSIDLVTGRPRTSEVEDLAQSWHRKVTEPVLAAHCSPKSRQRYRDNASIVAALMGESALVRHHGESGDPIESTYEASLRTGLNDHAIPYTRLYVLQIARFLASLLSELGSLGYELRTPIVPVLGEYFVIFMNEDEYLRKRKTWSIYQP